MMPQSMGSIPKELSPAIQTLIANKLSNSKPSKKQSANKNDKEFPFKPNINPPEKVSKVTNRLIAQSSKKDEQVFTPRYEALLEKHKLTQMKIKEKQELRIKKELQECTFKPNLNERSKKFIRHNEEGKSRFQILYEQRLRQDLEDQNKMKTEDKEQMHCTFKPDISKSALTKKKIHSQSPNEIKGFNKFQKRLKKAQAEKERITKVRRNLQKILIENSFLKDKLKKCWRIFQRGKNVKLNHLNFN